MKQNASQAKEEQLESQSRFERMANAVPVMLYESVLDSDGTSRFLYVAPKPCREILELNPEELLKDMSLVWRLVHPDDIERFQKEDLAANRAGKVFTSEVRIITPSGRLKWLLVNSKPNLAQPGKPVVWSGYLQDITERKQAVVKLKETEQKLRLIVEHSTNLFYIHSPDNVLTYVSPQSRQFFGCEPEEAMLQWTEFITDNPLNTAAIAATQRAVETGQQQPSYQVECITKKGRKIWAEVHETPIIENGNVVAIAGSLTDITERKLAEKALKESEFFFKESQRSAAIGSFKANLVEGFWESSEVMDAIFGIGPGYHRSIQGWLDLVHPEDREMMEQYLRDEVIAQGKSFAKEYRIIRANDGEMRWVSGLGSLISNSENQLLLMGTIQDITPQKREEEEKSNLEAQLLQAQKIEALGRLAGGVAHDFNNMLSIILGHVEIAQRKEDISPTLQKHLRQIHTAAERSADIVRQLLAFARKQTVSPKILDLNETIQGTLKLLRRLVGEEIELDWTPEKALWPVKLDPVQIDQILANLCVNARDAIAGFGRIAIETNNKNCDASFCGRHKAFVPGDYILLTVSDDGCGMTQQDIDMIFEPFFTTKEVGKGTGLGLAMVYGIVKQNSGYIHVHSEPGQGTTFQIYLPRHIGKDEQLQTNEPLAQIERGKETILVVEDEPAILDVSIQLLEMQGYRVLAASTPGEAIRLAEEHLGEIHLLMTDVVMPEMNGRVLAKKLLSLYPGLRCLFMSGYTADVIAHHGVLEEGVHFIHKPFSLNDIAAKLRKVFQSPQA